MEETAHSLAPVPSAPPPAIASMPASRLGATFGMAATSGLGAAMAVVAGMNGAPFHGFLCAAAVMLPAAGLGLGFGQRWKRWLQRDAATVSVGRWLGRLAGDGALAGATTAACSVLGLGAIASLGGLPIVFTELVAAAGVCTVPGALLGSALASLFGLPYLLAHLRGRKTWPIVTAVACTAPLLLILFLMFAL